MKLRTHDWQALYTRRIEEKGYHTDDAQLAIIEQFSRIERALNACTGQQLASSSGFLSRLFSKPQPTETIDGLYVYGSVGRGKTFLMDLFCEHIDYPVKRLHFHHFMKEIHDELAKIKDREDPLTIIAADFAASYRILCLDEFMVTDITDAMLLYRLLQSLIEGGVVIITTTNISPDDLYKNGLQRERFVPAIALIKSHCVIHQIDEGQDFRRICLERHRRFFSPLTPEANEELEQIVQELSIHELLQRGGSIVINQRPIHFVAKSEQVIWFSFAELCEGNRSQLDYIELAKLFEVVMVSDIPVLDEFKEDAARRFLLLIDELYDKRISLILSSEVPVEQIYTGKKIGFEFDRLQSRLFEMQSSDYGIE